MSMRSYIFRWRKGLRISYLHRNSSGSVISPPLISLFIVNCYEIVKSEQVKFNDDGTIWRTGKVWRDLVKGLEEDFIWIIRGQCCQYRVLRFFPDQANIRRGSGILYDS